MHEDLNEQLQRLSTELERLVRPAMAAEVRRRGDRRRSRTAVGAAAVSVTAVAVAAPVALGGGGAGGDGARLSPAGGVGSPAPQRPAPTPAPAPSPVPSNGWDTSIQQYNEDLLAFMSGCMNDLGFRWTGVVDEIQPTTEDEAAEWGFRISTVLEGDRSMLDGGAQAEDPIAEVRGSLPEDRREPFDEAVTDCWNEVPDAVPPDAGPPDRAIVIPGEDGSFSMVLPAQETEDGYEMSYHDEVTAMVKADPRMVAATASWSDCMADAGYDAASLDDIRARLRDMTQPFREAYEAGLPPEERGNDMPKSKLLDEVLTADQLAGLAEVQRYERAAALVSATCDDTLNQLLPVVWQDKLDEYFGYTG